MSLNSSEYKNRLLDQIEYFRHKAMFNRVRFRACQNYILIATVCILMLNVFGVVFDYNLQYWGIFVFISCILAVGIAVFATITHIEKYYQNWVYCRRIMALLNKEKYFFENRVGEYDYIDDSTAKKILVERIESICSGKNSEYFTIRYSKENNA